MSRRMTEKEKELWHGVEPMKHISLRLSKADLDFIDSFCSRTEALRLAVALLRMATEKGEKIKKDRDIL